MVVYSFYLNVFDFHSVTPLLPPRPLSPPQQISPCSLVSFSSVERNTPARVSFFVTSCFHFLSGWTDAEACGGAEVHAGIVLEFGDGLWERERTSEVGFNLKREKLWRKCERWLIIDRTRWSI